MRKYYELLGPSEAKLKDREYFKFLVSLYTLYGKMRGEEETKEELERVYKRIVEDIYKSTEVGTILRFPEIKIDKD